MSLSSAAAIIGRVGPRTEPKTDSRLAARLAALASLGAAVIHFAVVPAHWQEWMPAGVFFVVLASCQLIWAWTVLVRATTPVLAAGTVFNLAAIAAWALSRTAGVPFGPHAGQAEVVQGADLCALLLQIYVVMGAGWVWYRGLRGEPVTAFASAVVLLGAVSVVALASTVGVASGLRHDHHGPAAESDHHGPHVEQAGGHHGDHPHPPTSAPVEKANGTPAAPPEPVGTPVGPSESGETPAPSEPAHTPAELAPPSDDAHEGHDHDH